MSFKSSEYSSAHFNRLSDEYFTEHFQYQTALNNDNPGEINYQGVDLSRYLANNPSARRGVFLLTLSAWDPEKRDNQQHSEEDYDEDQEWVGDSRFVVITDLGIITKQSQDRSRDVFVQSIHSGLPAADAKVSVVAKMVWSY